MSERLPTGLLVTALLARTNDSGGIGMVRAKGDSQGGAILVIATEGLRTRVLERGPGPTGRTILIETGPSDSTGESIDDYWKRRRARDPDLWVIELDSPNAERFAAETIALD